MKKWIFYIFLFCNTLSFSQQKQVCFSFDDLPVVSYGINDSTYQKQLFSRIVSALATNKVPAIGFVNERKLYQKDAEISYQTQLLRVWLSAGLDLGNHTFSHPDYNNVTYQFFTNDILKGEIVLKKIHTEQGKQLRYFRHPFLHVGNTKAKADSLSDFLKQHNYLEAPVTIDNDDYIFALAYKRTKDNNDTTLMQTIGQDYLAYMEKKLRFYEMQSQKLFGRNCNQILLLHSNLLNSDYLNALIALYKANNYAFISMDNALKDTVYTSEITRFGNWGISWIDRWALSAGKKGDFFKDDPVTPDYIKKLAE